MSKAKQKKKLSQLKRKQMVEEVFKKSKKSREIAKKFDAKTAQRQVKDKFQQLKRQRKTEGNLNREQVAELDKKWDRIRYNKKPDQSSKK